MSGTTGQTVLSIVGYVVGSYFGMPYLGAVIGNAVGGLLDPPKGPTIVGPRLSDLSVQTSTYGANLPHIHGTVATMGNVFWLEGDKIKETPHKKKSGGKGGGGSTQKTWTYSATFAVGLCSTKVTGPIAGIRRIWVQGNLFYDAGSDDLESILASNEAATTFAVYLGTEDQLPDPRMQADKGVANTPAYRGRAYVVFYDLQLAEYGNSLMGAQVKVEVVGQADTGAVCPVFTALDATLPANRDGLCLSLSHDDGTLLVGHNTANTIIVTRRTLTGEVLAVEDTIGSFLVDGITFYPSTPSTNNPYSYYATRGDDLGIVVNNGVPCPLEKYTYKTAICDLNGVTYALHDGAIRGFENGVVLYEFAVYAPATEFHAGLSTDGTYLYVQLYGEGTPYNPEVETGGWVYEMNANLTINQKWPIGQLTDFSQGGVSLWPMERRKLAGSIDDEAFKIYDLHDDGTFTASCETSGSIVVAGAVGLPILYQPDRYFLESTPINPDDVLLSEIVEEECLQASDLTSGDIDVTALTTVVRGYRVTQTGAIRAAIEPLQGAWPFDIIQSGYKIKAVVRGGASVATIDAEMLDARPAGDAPGPQITIVREMDTQLPRRVTIKHLDLARDYDNGEQYAERLSDDSIGVRDMDMPIVLTAAEAAQKAEVLLYLYWLERHTIQFKLPPEYLALEPADVVTITAPGATYELRLTNINYLSDGRLECVAKYNSAAVYTPAALGEEGLAPTATIGLPGPSAYELMDIPALSTDMDEPLFVAAMTGYTASWPGGILIRSSDGGQTWADLQGWSGKSTMGSALSTIGSHAGNVVDAASLLQVRLLSGELESITEIAMLNGGNHFAYGVDGRWEIIAARTCTLQGDGSYHLTDFLRGRAGTEWATGLHETGDAVVLLNDADNALIGMETASIGLSRIYRGITVGRSIDSAADRAFTYHAVNLEPLSPVYLNGDRHPTTNDWSMTFVRRTRIGGEWRDLVDAPLSEATEAYEIDVFDDGTYTTVVRTITTSTPAADYTSAQQIADFGSNQVTVYVRVYQMSATVGRGYPLQASLTWSAASGGGDPLVDQTFATLNPLDKGGSLTLSGGNLTAVRDTGSGWNAVRSTVGKSTGKWYFEVVNNADGGTDGDAMWGFMRNTDSLATYPGNSSLGATSMGWQANATPDSVKFQNGSLGAVTSYGDVAPGAFAAFAIDLDAGKLWVRNNTSAWAGGGDPVSGTTPTFTFTANTHLHATIAAFAAAQSATVNFGATAFSGAVPSGFNEGWYAPELFGTPVYDSQWSTPSSTDAQGVATDGANIWYSSSTTIYKYTMAGSLVTSRDVSGDDPTNKTQINGMFIHEGTLYVSAAENSDPRKSYIVEYNPTTLAYIDHHQIVGDWFSEGLAWRGGHWWVCFHANKVVAKVDPSDWSVVATYDLSFSITGSSGGYGAATGYDGIAWRGDYLLANVHEIYDQNFLDVYYWTGTRFDEVARLPHITSIATQGLAVDPTDADVIWFAERNYSGTDSVAKAII